MSLELLQRAEKYTERTAIVSHGNSYSYSDLLDRANHIASGLLEGRADLEEARIAFLVSPSFEYVALQWGIWAAGGIAVPLCVLHPLPSLQYVIEDTRAKLVIAEEGYYKLLKPLEKTSGTRVINLTEVFKNSNSKNALPVISPSRRAMILYTSGTTSDPKGVVSTHGIIQNQITTLTQAWEWASEDYILNVLPLHHVHGIINVMSCTLWSGACCEFLPRFEAEKVWEAIASGRMTLFMAVPTIYYKLIGYWEEQEASRQKELSEAAGKLRLMVSGSAALPVSVLERWKSITGQILLERYGMTEIGMGLSNPYRGERKAGHVGNPLPGVEIKLVNPDFEPVPEGEAGEILIKGPSVFKEYWQKEEATKNAFTEEGWFKTGDIAVYSNGSYKILGRNSVDIIKSGGYKISALEIEEVLRKNELVADCAVIGLPDEEWGEIIAACVVPADNDPSPELLQQWLREYLPAYKIPRKIMFQGSLPRNVLGKITKNELKASF